MNISINNDYCAKQQKDKVKKKETPTSASNTVAVKLEKLNEEEILFVENKEYLSNSSSSQILASVSDKQNIMHFFKKFNRENAIVVKMENVNEEDIIFVES